MPVPDLISRATRFFVLAEQASRLGFDELFWELSAPPLVETVPLLPALTAAVKTVDPHALWPGILTRLTHQPLPVVLPPEAVLWHDRLIAAWEVHYASIYKEWQNLGRLALVRLDGCGMPDGQKRPSRLPEWLAEARRIASGEWRVGSGEWRVVYQKMEALAALAAWRPATRVLTPPETLREWVAFWLERRQSKDPMEKGIASIALLNLPEADLRAASIPRIPTGELLQQLSQSIRFAPERESGCYLSMLDWQPGTGTTWPVAELTNVARSWLEATRHDKWARRRAAWRQLIRWDRAGRLDVCGIDLLPELVQAVQTEKDRNVLWEMAQWIPGAERFTTTGTPVSLLRDLERAWKRHRTSWDALSKASGWLAGIRLHQAWLASEPSESFLKDCISTVADTRYEIVLLTLAQCPPGTKVPGLWCRNWHAAWQQRLLDEDKDIQQTAAWALLHQSLEKEHRRLLRGAALELWRAGVKVSPKARYILNAAFLRFKQVRTRLAAGEVPNFKKKLPPPVERCRPPLALPPGRIAGGEWQMENEELKMKNGEWRMKDQKVTPKPNPRLVPDRLSRSGMSE